MTDKEILTKSVTLLLAKTIKEDLALEDAAKENLYGEIAMCFDRVIKVPLNHWSCEGNPMTVDEAMNHIRATLKHVRSERFREYVTRK